MTNQEEEYDQVDFYNQLHQLFPSSYLTGKRRKLAEIAGLERRKRVKLESAFSALKENAMSTVEEGSSGVEVSDAETQTVPSAFSTLESMLTKKLATIFENIDEDEQDEDYSTERESPTDDESEISSKEDSLPDNTGAKLKELMSLLGGSESLSTTRYFKDVMTEEEREKALILAREVNKNKRKCQKEDVPMVYRVLNLKVDDKSKLILLEKARLLEELDPTTVEHYKLYTWLNNITKVPFGTYKANPVSLLDDNLSDCKTFLENAHDQLNLVTHGMEDAKLQIMQLLCQWVANPDANGSSIALYGPMGTGKTTIVKEGISKILGRDFVFIPLGGATDSSFLEGHSYTYEGSTFGKIVQALRDCGSMNPIFFFDELDKVSNTARGEEIIGILTHLTDSSQNNMFHDKYYSELSFDLSRAMYFFSFNNENDVNPILLDRMFKIKVKGYGTSDKVAIANKHLIPKARKDYGFNEEEILFTNDALVEIIEKYSGDEKGVRNLKRCINNIFARINMIRLMSAPEFKCVKGIEIKFPLSIDSELVNKVLHKRSNDESWRNLYI